MNKYRWFIALIVLVLASLACQTVMGGGNSPQVPNSNDSGGGGPVATEAAPPSDNGGGGGSQDVGGYPIPSDATNVISAADTVTYTTKMSVDEIMAFYRDAYTKQGLKERTSMTVTMGQLFTLVFDGDSSGKAISISGASMGDGTTTVTLVKQNF